MVEMVIYKFQPDAMDREILEKLFVGKERKKLLEKLTNEILEAAKNRTPRYYLIIGPRGVGKTHFITLLYYRIENKETLPVKLSEEEYSIYRVSDLFLRIMETLGKEIDLELEDEEIILASLEELRDRGKMVVLFIENLNQILEDQMDEKEVKRLRAIFQKENIFTVVATAPLIFPQISKHEEPFFNFFNIEYLPELTPEELKELIRNLAKIEKDEEFLSNIDEIEGKIESIRMLTGGSPRIAIVIYELMSKGKLVDVEKTLFKILDEHTPYYQDVFRLLSGEKRRIFDTLIEIGRPATPKEIAKRARLDEKVVNSQLRRLEKDGYLISHKIGRHTKYEVRERLFRLWRELRREPFGRKRLSILIEFLELWYSREERIKKFIECLRDSDESKIREASYLFLSLPPKDRESLIPEVVEKICESGELRLVDEIIEDKEVKARVLRDSIGNLLRSKKYEKLLKMADEIIESKKTSVLGYNLKTTALINLGRYEEALDTASKAVELDPKNSCAWCRMGQILGNLGKYEEALKCFSKAVELKPDDAYVWFNRGLALINLRRLEEALECFSKAVEIKPDFIEAWNNKGVALGILGKHEEALECFSRVTELDANNTRAWFNKGVALKLLGKHEEALEVFSKVIELEPQDACAWCNKGMILAGLNKIDEALESLSKAAELQLPEKECLEFIKGLIHLLIASREFKKKNYGNAIENLSLAMGSFDNCLKAEEDKEVEEKVNSALVSFLKDLIENKNVEAVDIALKVMVEKREKLKELLELIILAVEIVKSKNKRKYYDIQVEKRDVVVDIVKRLTGSTELVPEEYK